MVHKIWKIPLCSLEEKLVAGYDRTTDNPTLFLEKREPGFVYLG
jgi:hypothetical protein